MRVRSRCTRLCFPDSGIYACHCVVTEHIDIASALVQQLLEDRQRDAEAIDGLAVLLAAP